MLPASQWGMEGNVELIHFLQSGFSYAKKIAAAYPHSLRALLCRRRLESS